MLTPLRTAAILMGMCTLLSACEEHFEPSSALAVNSKLLRAGANAIPGRYIVVLEDKGAQSLQASPLEIRKASDTLTRTHGGTLRRVYAHALKAFSASLTEEEARRMSEDPRVRYVEQERTFKLEGLQNSPTWGLDRVDQRYQPLDNTYYYEYTGAGVHAYILDTGVRSTHVEFAGRMGNGFDAIGDGVGTEDCQGHGTHVAGTLGGATYGVAKQVTIHSVRIIECTGEGTLEQVLAGLDWVTANHVKPAVANMSIGAEGTQAVDDAVAQSIAAGVVYVVAAGNESVNACTRSPARTPQALTVGATGQMDIMSFFSNYGTCVDLFAPGERIDSAWYTGDTHMNTLDGTSMATPHAAGAAALYLEGRPNATPAEVTEELIARSTRSVVEGLDPGSPNVLLHTACMGSIGQVPPEVALTAPADGATLTGSVTLSATASDDVGVTKVEFYLGGALIGTDTSAPYSLTWDSNDALNGPATLSARAFDSSCNSRAASISVTIQNAGKAVFDPVLGAPVCDSPSSQCDSLDLLVGRGPLLGPEQNTPNALGHSCSDGASGMYQLDPSFDALRVVREDGGLLAPGKQVRIVATFFSSFDPGAERVDLFSAPDARSPVWTHITTLIPGGFGPNQMAVSFTIPPGSDLQAIRAVYRSGGNTSTCPNGSMDDVDDLAFVVAQETDSDPPTATLTAPAAGATIKNTVTLTATASDNFSVARVEFYGGTTLLGTDTTSPYSLSWDTRTTVNGIHELTVRAYDTAGLVGTSPAVSVTVNNDTTPPTVAFSAPAEGAVLSGTVSLSATASDNVGVTKVEFYEGTTLLGADASSPYSYSWNTRNVANGPYLLTVKAYDAAGNISTADRTVTADNDFVPPTVALTAPEMGATLIGTVTFSATASDDQSSISRVEFFVGATRVGTDTAAPYSFSYNTRLQGNGDKVITAKAYDAWNNVSTSEPAYVEFANDYTPPMVVLSAPEEGATLSETVVLSAIAGDSQSTISKVEFYVGTTRVGTVTAAPYNFSYNTRLQANGDKVITAKAYDAWNNVATSAAVNVTFDNDFTGPTVAVTAPAEGATLSETVTLSATASDDRASISKVEFYVGTTRVGTVTAAPYTYSYNTRLQANGAKVITAKAFDTWNNVNTSAPVNVTFDNDFTGPTVAVTAPAEGATLSEYVTLSATASDDRASISKVEFYVGTTRVGTVTAAPYTYSYNTRLQANGTKVVTAKAFDTWNNVNTSAPVNVTFDNDFTGPTVAVTAPAEGATLTGTVTLSATASDDRASVSKVEFYVGTTRVGTVTSAPYTYSYNTRLQANGAKVITAKAYDTWNNVSTSAPVNVTFDNDLTAPTSSVISPASGSTVSGVVQVTCAASDNLGVVSKVEIYTGSTLRGTVMAEPYSVSWDTTKSSAGTWPLKCRAFDPAGNSAYSPTISVTVIR
jgi:subtilisin family serine protease